MMENINEEKSIEEIVAERLQEEKAKMEAAFNDEILKIKADNEKLKELSGEQRMEYLLKQQEEELSKREKVLAEKELENQGTEILLQRKMPAALIGCIARDTEESLKKSVDILEKEFTKAVEAEVNRRIQSGSPKACVNYDRDPFLKGLKN